MMDAVADLAENHKKWQKDYHADYVQGKINHIDMVTMEKLENNVNQAFISRFA